MVFLAGVGHATIMDGDKIVATANTLIDSSITIGVSMEEVRAGMGAKLYGKYAHSSTFDLKLTDAMFNLEYLAMNTGSEVTIGGDALINETLTAGADKKLALSKTAVPFWTNGGLVAFIKTPGTDEDYKKVDVAADNTIAVDAEGEYCVRYMYNNDGASRMVIDANFIPKTLSIILEANLYSGGSCDVETSTLAGKIQIKVFRFMLNGNQELSMTSTGVSQTAIEGSALASGCSGCDNEGVYAEIIQVMTNEHWYSKAEGIMFEDAYREIEAGAYTTTPVVYAWFSNAAPKQLKASDYTLSIEAGTTGLDLASDTGIVSGTAAAGTAIVKAIAKDETGKALPMTAALTIVVG